MTYNILAINPGHNGSSALIVDGKTELYIEEERLSRMTVSYKHQTQPTNKDE